ncbi:FAD:protein FMN transferase [Paracoccus homiensis]|uniref:FAD:protein FMN transferase n=1 Tax=Paracoccus homiensis TaxID=364199 RepID=A0A1I0DKY2_9RHOB|nr:FAD:protein FMN transferase [Paracoccus homiensis]SET33011.1 thiamine biosynthesis lipoprotein [Paracoccus homiensis]
MSVTQRFSRRSFLILSTVSATALVSGKAEAKEPLRLSGPTMGTTYNIVAVPHGQDIDKDALQSAIDAALAKVNAQMSNWDETSEISRLNAAPQGELVVLSPELSELLHSAMQVHEVSEGRFDITVGPLIDAWGFGSKDAGPRVPSDSEIEQAMARSGQSRVLDLSDDGLRKTADGVEIYLSAIGKGYGVDRVADVMRDFGLKDFMVEIGGEIYASGRNAGGTPWQIGIESPLAGDRALHSVVDVSGMGMATSGDYRNFFEVDGKRYSHIIDPATGRPILHQTVSTTVLADDAMTADAWATAMLVLGRERGVQIADEQGLAVLFIDRDPDQGFVATASRRFGELQPDQ